MNKFGLVYENAIGENIPGKVNVKPVTYEVSGIKVAGNLYLPPDFDENNSYAAISVAHPNGGSKEQVAGLYAQKLAELGYVTLASDARYQGASEGQPRNRDYPENRIEDVSGMIDYLISLDYVNNDRTASLGICGGAGYTLAAAQQDKRINAVAVLSMFNTGRIRRNGFLDSEIELIQEKLQKGANARNKLLEGEILYEGDNPEMTEEELRKMMESLPEGLYRDGVEYYGITHYHPNANSRYTTESLPKLLAFDVDDRMDLISQPLLMMAGDVADTKYMTDSAFEKAVNAKNKELFLIEGASHIQTYWVEEYIDKVVDKLEEFFNDNL
ncbi:alpha/beta hydrolase [Methanobrevibacter sp.]|uniref:alpha/beta hydrolase n=1 Tax=Methanobrevibacter sp. TaxID=66852 RepID=UPI00388F6819